MYSRHCCSAARLHAIYYSIMSLALAFSAREIYAQDAPIVLPRPPAGPEALANDFVNKLPPYRQYAPTTPPISASDVTGCCPIYYRQRPYGHRWKKQQIMMQNRSGEPDWYRYYRCCHFGYYPTQWQDWPAGWDNCRHPKGPYPDPPANRSRQSQDQPNRSAPQNSNDTREPAKLPQNTEKKAEQG